ncbi:MAG: TIGR01212 family radical SAM protein [Bacteroidales bacterium]|nr:TIGR01212 family radical SAM protein [Bacteroidales bacterium]
MNRYNSYAAMCAKRYGGRVQKISVNAGFTCPNRDGTLGTTGCTFCNNSAFSPSYCQPSKSITQQLDEGLEFHRHRYRRAGRYVAYFQSFSNTYASLDTLRQRYLEALAHPEIGGIVVGTRPDCVDDATLDLLASLNTDGRYIAVEYGIESCLDRTLKLVGRGHNFDCTRRAIEATAKRGLNCGGHLILGLPGECRDDILSQAATINSLPLTSLKLHQLQLLRNTELASQVERGEVTVTRFDLDEYIALVCDFVERLRPDLGLERLAGEVPPRHQADPNRAWHHDDGRWVRNEEIGPMVEAELERRGTHQGSAIV